MAHEQNTEALRAVGSVLDAARKVAVHSDPHPRNRDLTVCYAEHMRELKDAISAMDRAAKKAGEETGRIRHDPRSGLEDAT